MRERHRWGYSAAIFAKMISLLNSFLNIRIYAIYTGELKDTSEHHYSIVEDISYRLYDASNYDELIRHAVKRELELDPQFIKNAIGKGDICTGVLIDNQLISYEWSAFSPTEDRDGIFATFPPNYRYGYKAFALPAYRGRHVRDGLPAVRDRYCLSKGYSRSVSFVSVANYSSIRATERLGRERSGYAVYFTYKQLFLRFHSKGCKRTGFEFKKL